MAVVRTAHHNEIFDEASCAGAPLHHPVTGRVEGVVSLTCRAEAANPLQLPLIAGAAREVDRRLLEAASAVERRLLESFTAAWHRTARPVLCVGQDVVLATPTAARLLEGVSQGLLWERALRAVASSEGERVCELPIEDAALLGRCRAVRAGDATVGVVVTIEPPPAPRPRARRPPPAPVPGLGGRGAAWRAAVAACREVRRLPDAAAVVGRAGHREVRARAGGGRRAGGHGGGRGARRRARGGRRAARLAGTSPLGLGGRAGDGGGAPRGRAHGADAARAGRDRGLVGPTPWSVATASDPAAAEALGARAVELPPLRVRPQDVAPAADVLLGRHGRPGFRQRLRPDALQLLERLTWPGNVRELEWALEAAVAVRRTGDLRPEDLPADLRGSPARGAATGLRRVEAEAIARALAACDGNKREAARELGIARSTLYRKLRAYGLEL